VEIHAKLITLLAEVDELKRKEAALKSEKQRHLEQIAQSEGEVSRCNHGERKRKPSIAVNDAHVVTDGENSQTDREAKRAWDARAKHLKQVR
jgi:hypothetical protein